MYCRSVMLSDIRRLFQSTAPFMGGMRRINCLVRYLDIGDTMYRFHNAVLINSEIDVEKLLHEGLVC
jgi:hypothetical protein